MDPTDFLAAVDPGVNTSGVAVFGNRLLIGAWITRAENESAMISALHRRLGDYAEMVIERPTVYSKNSKAPPDDLIRITLVAGGAAASSLGRTYFVEPRTWKGQVPKGIHHERVRAALSPAERNFLREALQLAPASLQHNVLDAVGLGLWHLGRLK